MPDAVRKEEVDMTRSVRIWAMAIVALHMTVRAPAAQDFYVAVSRDARPVLAELYRIFGVVKGAPGRDYKQFEPGKGGVDPLDDLASGFPGDRYRVLILTSAERSKIPAGNYGAIRQGRSVEAEFLLLAPRAEPANLGTMTHVAIPDAEQSFREFFHQGLLKCVSRRDLTPVMTDPKKEKTQLLVVKAWDDFQRYHDSRYVSLVEEQWEKLYPLPYFPAKDSAFAEALTKCLKPSKYTLRTGIPHERLRRLLNGVRLEVEPQMHASGVHAAGWTDDIEIVAADSQDVDMFFNDLWSAFDRLLTAARLNREDKTARETVQKYGAIYRFLTNDDRVSLALAEREYEYARYEWTVLETTAPVKSIDRQLKDGRLLTQNQYRAVTNAMNGHEDYWKVMKEVRKPVIDSNRLRARIATARLANFLYRHWSLAKDFKEADSYRLRAQDEFAKLEAEIRTVEAGGTEAYRGLRDTEEFDSVKNRYEDLRQLGMAR
jgi:hypothetical protein